MSNTAVYIGGPSPETVKVLSSTLLDILNAPHCDERTKQLALKTLAKGVEAPTHSSISHCNFQMEMEREPSSEVENTEEQDEADILEG